MATSVNTLQTTLSTKVKYIDDSIELLKTRLDDWGPKLNTNNNEPMTVIARIA